MEKKIDYRFVMLQVVSWVIFIGLCIETGGFISSTIYTLFYNSAGANMFWTNINFNELYNFNQSHFISITVLMIIVSVLKSIMFYIIVSMFYKNRINLSNPFNEAFGKYIFKIAYLVLGIGLFTYWGTNFTTWIVAQNVNMPTIQQLNFAGADVWLFMGVTLLIFAKIFQKGLELKAENDLTI